MRNSFLKMVGMVAVVAAQSSTARAMPVEWTFNDVTFADGSTTTGSFIVDIDEIISWDITTTCGSACDGQLTVTDVSGGDFDLAISSVDQSGDEVDIYFYFLTHLWHYEWAGGTVNPGGTVPIDFGQLYAPEGQPLMTSSGYVTTVPVPAALWLFGSALAGMGWLAKKPT